MPPAKILVVDDDPTIRLLLRGCLSAYQVIEARDGEEGLARAAAEKPDLLIVDWTMPKMDGNALCRAIRQMEEVRSTPVIMLTAREQAEDQVLGLASGADDYVVKPFDPQVLLARVEALLKRLEQVRHVEPLMEVLGRWYTERGVEQLGRELEVAREIQMGMLPQQIPQVPGLEVGASLVPCSVVGGDFYDFFPHDETALGAVVADVSGKGVPAALLMVMVRTMLRLLLREGRDLLGTVRTLNEMLVTETSPDWFVTMCYMLVEPGRGRLVYANAGHCPILRYRTTTGEQEILANNGPGLGIFPGEGFQTDELPLESGDVVVSVTDGIVDAAPGDTVDARYEAVISEVREHAEASAAELAQHLVDSGAKADERHRDDLTAVVLKAV
ncbi:MAG: PP2C family protein-serine/threonine phosphatase [Armatimonadota bacterium]